MSCLNVATKITEVGKNSVVVIQTPQPITKEQRDLLAQSIKEDQTKGKFPNVPVLIMPYGWSLDSISEEDMNRLGWYR